MTDPVPMIRTICMYAALVIAIVCIANALGVNVPVLKSSGMELIGIGILCALVGR